MRLLTLVILAASLAPTMARPGLVQPAVAQIGSLPPGFAEASTITGFSQPTGFDWTPDGRIIVAEKETGNLRVVKSGNVLSEAAVTISISTDSERGLLGVAVDPQFAA